MTHYYNSYSRKWYSDNLFLEENVFLGCNVIICKGVKIGRNCVVGAGSVVTKDFEENSVYAGVPAKKIGEHIL
ncbi:acyltransferase [Treponema sp.]|uniref:acyltransferase n=1 Tax=Treponema sp. TaxID=166 RepID=UPI003F013D23